MFYIFTKQFENFSNFLNSLCWVNFCWMSPLRTEILATLLEILSDVFPPRAKILARPLVSINCWFSFETNPGCAPDLRYKFTILCTCFYKELVHRRTVRGSNLSPSLPMKLLNTHVLGKSFRAAPKRLLTPSKLSLPANNKIIMDCFWLRSFLIKVYSKQF